MTTSKVLELANGIQGPMLAFERHPEGGVRPAFPARPIDMVRQAADQLSRQAREGFAAMGIPICDECGFDGHFDGCSIAASKLSALPPRPIDPDTYEDDRVESDPDSRSEYESHRPAFPARRQTRFAREMGPAEERFNRAMHALECGLDHPLEDHEPFDVEEDGILWPDLVDMMGAYGLRFLVLQG